MRTNWSKLASFAQETGHLNCFQFCECVHYSEGTFRLALRKLAYSNILKFLPPENRNFQIKNSFFFHISAQNIDCGYSLEPHRAQNKLWILV